LPASRKQNRVDSPLLDDRSPKSLNRESTPKLISSLAFSKTVSSPLSPGYDRGMDQRNYEPTPDLPAAALAAGVTILGILTAHFPHIFIPAFAICCIVRWVNYRHDPRRARRPPDAR
jgi:hypothetical protein